MRDGPEGSEGWLRASVVCTGSRSLSIERRWLSTAADVRQVRRSRTRRYHPSISVLVSTMSPLSLRRVLLPLLIAGAARAGAVQLADGIVLHDAARNRDIPVKVYFPDAPGKYPVIVFSHGLGGSKEGYEYLGRTWAEHGYVSIHPTHPGSDSALLSRGHPLETLQALKESALDPKNWVDRPKDVSFLLSSLEELERRVPGLKDKLDTAHVGVAGHSFGAYTTMAVAGGKPAVKGNVLSLADDRPIAFIAMSPQGEAQMGWNAHSWDDVRRPLMAITGTEDRGFGGEPATWRLTAFEHLPPGDKFQVVFDGANHFTFAGVGRAANEKFLQPIEVITTTFWDAYLKGDPAAKASLKSGKAWTGPGVALSAK